MWVILDLPRGVPQLCRLPALLETFPQHDQAVAERQDQTVTPVVLLTQAVEQASAFGITVVSILAVAVMFQM